MIKNSKQLQFIFQKMENVITKNINIQNIYTKSYLKVPTVKQIFDTIEVYYKSHLHFSWYYLFKTKWIWVYPNQIELLKKIIKFKSSEKSF